MTKDIVVREKRWVRSRNGYIAGICEGLASRLGLPSWVLRAAWLFAVLAYGVGAFLYLVLAICLPREDRASDSEKPKLLGVCLRLSHRFGIEPGILRALVIFAALASLGTVGIAYVVLHFVLPQDDYITV